MTFGVFTPPQAETRRVPVVYWLSGLTCTDENMSQKAGAQRVAAQLGLALVMPDTSPRGHDLPGEKDTWDFGLGAGFYVNATQEPWKGKYNMYDYVSVELPSLLAASFAALDTGNAGIFGHSMGGHGALVLALRNPGLYRSVSAFAPICNPTAVPWGIKAFTGYLGDEDKEAWKVCDRPGRARPALSFFLVLMLRNRPTTRASCSRHTPAPSAPSWWTRAPRTPSWRHSYVRSPWRMPPRLLLCL